MLFNKDLNKKFKTELDRKLKTKQNLNKLKIANKLQRMSKEIKLEKQILDKCLKRYNH